MTKVKVAIITRTKDRPVFLTRAINSVFAQTYGNYIHVIVNDGGDVSEVERIIEQSGHKNSIRLFHREVASGAPDTIFNESINRVDSEYIAIHDDDDTWHPDFLLKTIKHFDENIKLGAVVVRTDKVIEEVRDNNIIIKSSRVWMPELKVISLYRQCIDNQLTPIATLLKRSAYSSIGGFDDSLPVVGDWEFGIRLLSKYDVDFIDPGFALACYHHRVYKNNVQGNTSFAGNDRHRYYTNQVINRYLRKDIEKGTMGLGYIMANLKYSQTVQIEAIKKVMPRIIVSILKKRMGD